MHISQQYHESAITSASQGELIIMMYEGAIKKLRSSLTAIQDNNLGEANNHLIRAQEIIHELSMALDLKDGTSFSKNLSGIYDYMVSTLIKGNLKKDPKPITEVLDYLSILLDTWKKAINDNSIQHPKNPSRAVDIAT